jgi:hypothetical protein
VQWGVVRASRSALVLPVLLLQSSTSTRQRDTNRRKHTFALLTPRAARTASELVLSLTKDAKRKWKETLYTPAGGLLCWSAWRTRRSTPPVVIHCKPKRGKLQRQAQQRTKEDKEGRQQHMQPTRPSRAYRGLWHAQWEASEVQADRSNVNDWKIVRRTETTIQQQLICVLQRQHASLHIAKQSREMKP